MMEPSTWIKPASIPTSLFSCAARCIPSSSEPERERERVCVCVREREREREKWIEGRKEV